MLRKDGSGAPVLASPIAAATASDGSITRGAIASLFLHGLIAAVLGLALLWTSRALPPVMLLPINLVQLGDVNASPPASQAAPLPQEKAASTAPSDAAAPIPAATAPPPEPAPDRAGERVEPAPTSLAVPPEPAPPPRSSQKPGVARSATKPAPRAVPDPLSQQLRQLGQLRQAPETVPRPGRADGPGASNVTASSDDASSSRNAVYRVRDFLRAQIERRWTIDSATVGRNWSVNLRLVLSPAGVVDRADIVPDPRFAGDAGYQIFARNARNAALLSSPLVIPSGDYDIAADITIELSAAHALR